MARVLALLLACAACTPAIEQALPPPSGPIWFPIAVRREGGERTRVLQPTPVDFPLAFDVGPDETLALIGLEPAAAHELRPAVSEALSNASLVEGPPPECPNAELRFEQAGLRLPLPGAQGIGVWTEQGGVLSEADSGSPALAGLSVDLPLAADVCPATAGPAHAFGDQLKLLPMDSLICDQRHGPLDPQEGNYRHLRQVVGVAPDQALVFSSRALLHLRRGQPYDDARESRLCSSDLATLGLIDWQFRGLVAVPGRAGRFLVAGIYDDGTRGAVLELELGPSGLNVVRSATVTPSTISALDVADDGSTLVVGDAGLVLTATSPSGVYRRQLFSGHNLSSAKVTGDPMRPFLAGTDAGYAVVGRVDQGRLSFRAEDLLRAMNDLPGVLGVGARAEGDEIELWASAGSSLHVLRAQSSWSSKGVPSPPLPERCERITTCGRTVDLPYVRRLLVHRGVLLALSSCGALFAHDPDRECSSYVDLSAGIEHANLAAAAVNGDKILFAGDSGTVLEAPLPSP